MSSALNLHDTFFLVNSCEVLEEALKEPDVILYILAAHGLPDAVHRERRNPHIHGPDPDPTGYDGADGAAARRVVTNNELLDGRSAPPGDLAKNKTSFQIGGVPLIFVRFDDCSFIEDRLVLLFVLLGVVGMDSVGHVSGDEERLSQRYNHIFGVVA